ncbi:MAG: OmpH family outer membrane protein [Candidatus Glassbacteria bacterium]
MAANLTAQQIKLGFVEQDKIIEKLPARAELQKVLDQETALWDKKFQDKQQELKIYLDSLKAATDTLTAARTELIKADSLARTAGSKTGEEARKNTAGGEGEPRDTLKLAAAVSRLETSLEKKKKEVVAFYHEIYGNTGVLKRRNAELTQSILERVDLSLSEVCESLQMLMVFDSSILLYVDQDNNYTKQVMEALHIETEGAR